MLHLQSTIKDLNQKIELTHDNRVKYEHLAKLLNDEKKITQYYNLQIIDLQKVVIFQLFRN